MTPSAAMSSPSAIGFQVRTAMSLSLRHFCLAFCLCIAAAAASAAPFTSPRGYMVSPPPDWHVDSTGSSGNDVVIYTHKNDGDPVGTPAPNFGVRIGPQGEVTTLEFAKRGLIPFYRKGYPNLVLVSQTYSRLDKERDLDTTFLVGNSKTPTRIHQVLVLRNHQVYFFTSACAEQIHLKYDPIFAQMLASVHWKS